MRRVGALIWLLVELLAAAYLGHRLYTGLNFRTDLMALLPREELDPTLQSANDAVTRSLSRRVVILIGQEDRAHARAAAAEISQALDQSGLVTLTTSTFDKDRLSRMGKLYFPYRRGLLAEADRQRLLAGKTGEVATRALSQVFGFVGMADAGLLRHDPFLLLPAFFADLPLPLSRLALDEGMLSLQAEGKTWVLLSGALVGEPYALETQARLANVLDASELRIRATTPRLEVLRLGAVFFAKAGAEQAIGESTRIAIASTLGTILLVLAVFRAATPLWLTLLTIGAGIMTALAASLALFGELHVGALLFGVSLIGVTVDYSLQYCTEIFAPGPQSPRQRLARVLIGISLGTATTIIGYLTLMLAPFPGLHQIAAFSAVGLFAAWATVVLWLPALDRSAPPRHGWRMLAVADRFLFLWQAPGHARTRLVLLGIAVLSALTGAVRFHVDDDVKRMQSLSRSLVIQQERIQRLVGAFSSSQFFLVQASDTETTLQQEEELVTRLRPLVGRALAGFQAPAQYVPSAGRQRANRALMRSTLDGGALTEQTRILGLTMPTDAAEDSGPVLTLDEALKGTLSFVSVMVIGDAAIPTHVVMLDGVSQTDAVAVAAQGLAGVRFIDPARDFSRLLGKYRSRALLLLALSAVLMAPLLTWRYGGRGALRVMLPPAAAVILTPGLRALTGAGFSFFDAMALVLVLSIGVDYAVFCAETGGERKSVTILAVAMAAATALMSFGLLALSSVLAVHAFGLSMTIGVLLAFLLAPLACHSRPELVTRHWSLIAERGAFLGLRFVAFAYALLGRRCCLLILRAIVVYLYATDPQGRAASSGFLSRVRMLEGRTPPGWRDGLRHYMSFAEKSLDTFIAWSRPDRAPVVRVVGAQDIDRLAAAGCGGLLIVSHLGNAEMCRSTLQERFAGQLHVLMHTTHAVHYNRLLKSIAPDATAHVIEVTEIGPATAIGLEDRVQRGEWIAIAGDRTPIGGLARTSRVPFLGASAAFSQGPYILASLMKCPVYLLFCLRDRGGYRVLVEEFAPRIDLPRREKEPVLHDLAARYAARLEYYCRQAPDQWYNFYDFWAEDGSAALRT